MVVSSIKHEFLAANDIMACLPAHHRMRHPSCTVNDDPHCAVLLPYLPGIYVFSLVKRYLLKGVFCSR
jgi:hypothetical protein